MFYECSLRAKQDISLLAFAKFIPVKFIMLAFCIFIWLFDTKEINLINSDIAVSISNLFSCTVKVILQLYWLYIPHE